MTFAQLQHSQVVVGLGMVIIKSQSQFERLIGQCQVPYALQTRNMCTLYQLLFVGRMLVSTF